MTNHLLHSPRYFAVFLCLLFFVVCLLTFPIQTISQAGSYTASLTVANSSGSKSVSQTVTGVSEGAVYYVDTNNPVASDSNPGTESLPWKTISKANTTLVAGDTVYIKGGTYSGITGSAIDPVNTGTAGNIITYSSYNNEDVQIVGSGTSSLAVDLDSEYGTVRSYIKVHDLHFTNFMEHLWIRKGSHNEISYCSFIGYPAGATKNDFLGTWSASYIYRQATYNWIHHCTFGQWGICEPYGTDVGVVFQVGVETSTTDHTQYNLIEDNEFYHGGHHVVSFNGSKNVFRNNYCHNEPWYPLSAPVYSTRTFFQTGAAGDGCYNLVEGNRIGYGGPKNKIEIGGAGGTISGAYNIWRKNVFLQIYTDAMWVTKYSGQTDVKYNHIYNNTYWHGGYGNYQKNPGGTVPSPYWDNAYTHPICITENDSGTGVYGNAIKNNIFYDNRCLLGKNLSIIRYYPYVIPTRQEISKNWLDNAGDPKFIDISGTPDPMNKNQFDFRLQRSSPCIDAGGALTTITSASGSGTVFTVADAGYFMDGWGIPGVDGDDIQIVGTSQKARIINVDYGTNTITVNASLTWVQNQGVALAYVGAAPDLGAYEYGGTKADFNQDRQEDILWRYYGSGGENYVWYMGTSGGAGTNLQTAAAKVINLFQNPAPAKVYWDAREAGGLLERTPDKVYRDAREAAGPRSLKKALAIPEGQFIMPGPTKGIRTTKTPMENAVGILGLTCIGTALLPAVLDLNWQIVGTVDFNRDGKVDILWRYYGSAGYNYVWYMDGVMCIGGAYLPSVTDPKWQIAGTGDFNGDGKADILWRYYGSAGYNYVWYMDGVTRIGEATLTSVADPNWVIAGTGDFNGDKKADILWRYYGSAGYNYVWYMDGVTRIGEATLTSVADPNWVIAGTGDFNGDGKADILWRYYGSAGYNYVWYMDGVTRIGEATLYSVPDINWRIQNH